MSPSQLADLVYSSLCLLGGLAIGSYLNVLITRLPMRIFSADGALGAQARGSAMDVSSARSACVTCGTRIAWFDNMPLVSFYLLKGRCRACQARISRRYPVVELAGAVVAVTAFHVSVASWHLPFVAAFLFLLIALTVIDLETGLLPDLLTLGGLGLGLSFAALLGWDHLADSIWGAALGFGALWGLAEAYRQSTGREGMGRGDFKLAAMLGAWLGLLNLWLALTLAFVSGTMVAVTMLALRKETMQMSVPFGPFLCFGAAVAFVVDGQGINWLDAWTNLVLGY